MSRPRHRSSREPFDDRDRQGFARYVQRLFGNYAYDPAAGDPDEGPGDFRLSLQSIRAYMADYFLRRDGEGRAFRCYPAFVDLGFSNAFADRRGHLHLCGIHTGLAVGLIEFSLFAFAQSRFFAEIGEATGEHSPHMPSGGTLAFWLHDLTSEQGEVDLGATGAGFIPRDPDRFLAAHFLAALMLRFVWMHEVSHCLNGHVGLRKRLGLRSSLQEMPEGAAHSLQGIVVLDGQGASLPYAAFSHCLEFDADRSALLACVAWQASDEENIQGIKALPRRLRLRMTLFAALTLAYVFDRHEHRAGIVFSTSHPSAHARLCALMRTIEAELGDRDDDIRPIGREALHEFAMLQSRIPALFDVAQLMRDLDRPALRTEMDRMDDLLETIRERLVPHRFR